MMCSKILVLEGEGVSVIRIERLAWVYFESNDK